MSGLMLQMPHNADLSLAQFQSTALLTQGILNVALVLPALFVRSQPSLESVYKVALPLSATGFLLLPLIWSGGGGIANACAQLGAGMANSILWCMVANEVRALRDAMAPRSGHLAASVPFACAFAVTGVAQLAGTIVGVLFRDSMGQGGIVITGLALAAIYLVAMMSMFLFRGRRETVAAPQAGNEDAGRAASDDRCAELARKYCLTPREQEILAQLAGGRTIGGIARELTVSENTVKYHVKSVYQKLDVHSRNEVVELLGRDEG